MYFGVISFSLKWQRSMFSQYITVFQRKINLYEYIYISFLWVLF